ncbi:Phage integrase family protein [Hespellia stercorisuis DSM 15480]|uniref:Phage integrase family protein n=2 Tax=Hespellia stercorisuis TaxID=180311 RepID=A0A1M6SU98_9FIRM|nr:Phage integrase family protein [Hespellia stercorisuis DSM 15480]
MHKLNWIWEKYYEKDSIATRKVSELKIVELKMWCIQKIEAHTLTSRQFKDMKSVMNMLLDYAVELELIVVNPARSVRGISYKKFKPQKKKSVQEQVYVNDEESLLIDTALEGFRKTKNTAYLAVCLNCTLACRVGELVAIQLTDISSDTLHIQRQEIKNYELIEGVLHRHRYRIAYYTKSTDSDRYIPLTSISHRFLEMIIAANEEAGFHSEYLFLDNDGERMNNDVVNNVLRRLNRKINTIQKGNHSIRKTCLSNMNASKLLSDEELRTFAGHKEVSTTQRSYVFAVDTLDRRQDAYEQAICGRIKK